MADLTKKIFFIILYWICETRLISAYYCNWGSCTPDKECCAPHKCCPKPSRLYTNETLYVMTWILVVLIIVITCALFKYKNQICRKFNNSSGDKIPFAA